MKIMGQPRDSTKTKDYSWIRQFGDSKENSKVRPFDLGEDEIKDEKTSRINTVNR